MIISAGVQPLANFSATPTSGEAPLNVNFVDESTGTISSWYWDFWDGTNSYDRNPSHTYAIPGIYTVSLTVSGLKGSNKNTSPHFSQRALNKAVNVV